MVLILLPQTLDASTVHRMCRPGAQGNSGAIHQCWSRGPCHDLLGSPDRAQKPALRNFLLIAGHNSQESVLQQEANPSNSMSIIKDEKARTSFSLSTSCSPSLGSLLLYADKTAKRPQVQSPRGREYFGPNNPNQVPQGSLVLIGPSL